MQARGHNIRRPRKTPLTGVASLRRFKRIAADQQVHLSRQGFACAVGADHFISSSLLPAGVPRIMTEAATDCSLSVDKPITSCDRRTSRAQLPIGVREAPEPAPTAWRRRARRCRPRPRRVRAAAHERCACPRRDSGLTHSLSDRLIVVSPIGRAPSKKHAALSPCMFVAWTHGNIRPAGHDDRWAGILPCRLGLTAYRRCCAVPG
jgi:hypothetical protein